MPDRFANKVAVVTGGASGMGRETSLRLAREGASVVVADLLLDRAQETVSMIEGEGGRAVAVATDTSKEAACEALADAAVDAYGRIDLCLAAAGILHAGYVSGQIDDVDPLLPNNERYLVNKPVEHWEKVLAVNLTGVMLTDKAIAKRMLAQGTGGAIVNIASGAAKVPIRGLGDYCVSKAGVWMLTKVMALELAHDGIRVNAIGPGVINTPMVATITADEERTQATIRGIPLGRMGEPADIAETALFLLSDAASFITGQIIHPDGGTFTG